MIINGDKKKSAAVAQRQRHWLECSGHAFDLMQS